MIQDLEVDFPKKLKFLFHPCDNKIAYGGRAGCKSWGFAIAIVELASAKKLRILCTRETMESIAGSVYNLLVDTIGRLGLTDEFTVLKREIIHKRSESVISFKGLSDPDAFKSLEAADIVWVEEAQTITKNRWDKVIPTIRKEGSELWVSFNPELATDDTYKRFVLNPPRNSIVCKIGWEDNRWLSERAKVEIEDMREKRPDDFAHIYGGEPKSSVTGAIFGLHMKKALEEGRIRSVPYNKMRPVYTIWDIGFDDPTAIWFVQAYDGYYHFIDYYEDNHQTTADYVIELQNRRYAYDTDWLPHDGIDTIIHGRLNGTGDRRKSIEMLLREANRNVRIVPKLLLTDQINSARLFIDLCCFDMDKCADGLQALRHYQWESREAKGTDADPRKQGHEDRVNKNTPLHNWASHASSAFMGASIAMEQPKRNEPVQDNGPAPPSSEHYGNYSPFA